MQRRNNNNRKGGKKRGGGNRTNNAGAPSTAAGAAAGSSSEATPTAAVTSKRGPETRPSDVTLPLPPSKGTGEKRSDAAAPSGAEGGEGAAAVSLDDLDYEDPFPDEESDEGEEEVIVDMAEGGEEAQNEEEEEEGEEGASSSAAAAAAPVRAFRPGIDELAEGQVLEYDSSAYDMFHRLQVEWPCLSFDVLIDKLGYERSKYPHTVYVVSGTQADQPHNNKVQVMKASQLHKTRHDMDEDEDDEEDEDLDDDPIIEYRSFKHVGGVNRIRAMPTQSDIVATWSETGAVHVWDIGKYVKALDAPPATRLSDKHTPLQTFRGHGIEGFAMDWSTTKEGRLVTGDCNKFIYLWEFNAAASQWAISSTPYSGHTASVEDLQWSPSEQDVFASCSVDQTIKIWDARTPNRPGLSAHAHSSDVNVISWNRKVNYLLLSGSDDGTFRIWDLRNFSSDEPAANMKYHRGAITSLEWHPTEESMLAVAGEDDQITTWDMSLEAEEEVPEGVDQSVLEMPPQLLFVHQGQHEVKEVHWHPQIPGTLISTSSDGLNIYKSSNV
ncbi:Glutamate rich WD repeat containing 1 [Balamuthia mandrillaris]